MVLLASSSELHCCRMQEKMTPEKMKSKDRPARIRKPRYSGVELMPRIEFTMIYYDGP